MTALFHTSFYLLKLVPRNSISSHTYPIILPDFTPASVAKISRITSNTIESVVRGGNP